MVHLQQEPHLVGTRHRGVVLSGPGCGSGPFTSSGAQLALAPGRCCTSQLAPPVSTVAELVKAFALLALFAAALTLQICCGAVLRV